MLGLSPPCRLSLVWQWRESILHTVWIFLFDIWYVTALNLACWCMPLIRSSSYAELRLSFHEYIQQQLHCVLFCCRLPLACICLMLAAASRIWRGRRAHTEDTADGLSAAHWCSRPYGAAAGEPPNPYVMFLVCGVCGSLPRVHVLSSQLSWLWDFSFPFFNFMPTSRPLSSVLAAQSPSLITVSFLFVHTLVLHL